MVQPGLYAARFLPYIGKYGRKTKNIFVATGYRKWGMTQSMVAAKVIEGLITGNKTGYEDVFSPQRKILPELGGYMRMVGHTAKAYGASVCRLNNPACSHMGGRLTWNQENKAGIALRTALALQKAEQY